MELGQWRTEEEEEEEEEDVATQYVIEQSLKEAQQQEGHGDTESLGHASSDSVKVFSAIRRGDEQVLSECVKQTEVLLDPDSRGWLPLHAAAAQKNQSVLELTLRVSGEAALQSRTLRGKTPLLLAVEAGLLQNVALLLQRGADPDTQDHEDDSPLVIAVRSARSDLAELLLARGADVNQRGRHGRCALHEASGLGSAALVELLLAAGAHPDPRSDYGLTPLALAAQGAHLEVVQTLLGRGASALSQAQDEASVLLEACERGSAAVIRLLLAHGADANLPSLSGHLPLHRTARRGHLEALLLLLPVTTGGAIDECGMSPLHAAAAGAHTHCIQALLQDDYDPNSMLHPCVRRNYDDDRKSVLFFAVSNNDMPSAKMLLEAGAFPNQDPIKCLQVALRLGNYELIRLLLRHGANVNYFCRVNTTHFPSALQYALRDEVMLRMLCNYGYDVKRCFDCNYGDGSHVPDDYDGWTDAVIKDTMFCEVITVYFLADIAGCVVRVMLDYVDHVTICSKLKKTLMERKQWPDICRLQENPRRLQHLCRLKIRSCLGRLRLRAPVFMSFLPLPRRLKDYILYREYDLHGQQQETAPPATGRPEMTTTL